MAMTSLGDDVFVVCGSSQVEVYDVDTCTFQCYIAVPRLRHSYGLAACDHYKCLYVADFDWDAPSIHRVELSDCLEQCELVKRRDLWKKWSVNFGPRGLSVNKEHNLVACFFGYIHEYTTHGTPVRGIGLYPQASPWHAVQLSTGDYVISDWSSTGALIVVGPDGQVLHSRRSTHDEGLQCPLSPAVTTNDEVLVVNEFGHRILLIDSSLSFARQLDQPVHRTLKPEALCLDESRRRLYLGE